VALGSSFPPNKSSKKTTNKQTKHKTQHQPKKQNTKTRLFTQKNKNKQTKNKNFACKMLHRQEQTHCTYKQKQN
jgi:hypothetical protein